MTEKPTQAEIDTDRETAMSEPDATPRTDAAEARCFKALALFQKMSPAAQLAQLPDLIATLQNEILCESRAIESEKYRAPCSTAEIWASEAFEVWMESRDSNWREHLNEDAVAERRAAFIAGVTEGLTEAAKVCEGGMKRGRLQGAAFARDIEARRNSRRD